MDQATLEASSQFEQNNGMTIEAAYQHVKNWFAEGYYQEAIDGCEEIKNYISDYEDVNLILSQAKAKIQSNPENGSVLNEENTIEINTSKTKTEEEIYPVSQDEKIISAIGYLGFLAILPLLMKKESEYCQFHGKQALVLAILFFFYRYLSILDFIPVLNVLIAFILHFAMFIELSIILFAMIQAYRGAKWKIPGIYGMSQKLKF